MSRWIAPSLIGIFGLCGYLGGSIRKPAPEKTSIEVTHVENRQRNLDRNRITDDTLADFDRLLTKEGTGTDIWKVVSKLSEEDISQALARLRELRQVTPGKSPVSDRLDEIESALYFHWAEMDPQGALADIRAIPYPQDMREGALRVNNLVKSVLSAWMRVDPKAAYTSVIGHEKFGYIGRNMLVATWNNETAFTQLAHFPEKHRDLFGHYCGSLASDPARRDDMLDRLARDPDMKNADWGKFLLFRKWGYQDFNAAITEAENRHYPDMVKLILSDNISYSPQAALPWALKNGLTPDGPSWEAGYSSWLSESPDNARQWFKEAATQWKAAGKEDLLVRFVSQDLAVQLNAKPDESADLTSELKSLVSDWSEKDPAAAEKWVKAAPEPIKKALEASR